MIDFSEFLRGASSWIDTALGITGIGSFILSLILSFVNYRLTHKVKTSEATIASKDKDIALLTTKVDAFTEIVNHQSNIIGAAFMDSNIGVRTKTFISEELNEIKKLGAPINKAIDVIKEEAPAVIEKINELKENIVTAGTQAFEQAKDIADNTKLIYNKIINKR